MRFHDTPRPLLQLITTILLAPRFTSAGPNPHPSKQAGFTFNELFARYDCSSGTTCGYYGQLCCSSGSACYTDAESIALCTATSGTVTTTVSGSWQYYTTTYVETDLVTMTSVYSSYIGATATATAAACDGSLNESSCGSICCASDQYCFTDGQCTAAAGGSSGYATSYTASATASAAIRETTSAGVVITATVSPTTTVPFATPVATGANITVTSDGSSGGSGLSGGAIAGIVIGVLAALLLLGLICFYCCLKGLLDGCLACFGLGGRRRKRTEVEEYERRSHRTSGGGGGRTWYGAARPATRVDRTEKRHEERNLLGIGAGLAALWAILGLKRRQETRRSEKNRSEYSYSSDYYTSASSASSDDRRTRDTRRSMGRR